MLDVGCGNGAKLAELVGDGAIASVGVDISGNFLNSQSRDLEFIRGDLSELGSVPGLVGRRTIGFFSCSRSAMRPNQSAFCRQRARC